MTSLWIFPKRTAMACAVGTFVAMAAVPEARAELVTTDRVLQHGQAADARARIDSFLVRDDVRAQMEALGVLPEEAEARIASLSDQELSEIAGTLESLPAGQGTTVLLVAIILLLVVMIF